VAKAILLRLMIAAVFVVPGWIFMAYVMQSDSGTPAPGTRGAQAAEFMANAALNSAAEVMGAHHGCMGRSSERTSRLFQVRDSSEPMR
jgi:hypothetical protein